MSSMRNAVARRPHKERSQPTGRQKWGILEKHKDYSLRAADYNLKKKKLSQLSQKARERNPDEFAFGMLSAEKGTAGKHGKNSEKSRLSHDAVKLLKTQDAGYLRTVAGRGRREIERLEEEVQLADVMKDDSGTTRAKKIVFVDGEAPPSGKKRKRASVAESEVLQDMPPMNADLDMLEPNNEGEDVAEPDDRFSLENVENSTSKFTPGNKSSKPQSGSVKLLRERKRRKRFQELRAAKLSALKKRQREIKAAADVLEAQRARMARTVGGVNKDGVKFRVRERKK